MPPTRSACSPAGSPGPRPRPPTWPSFPTSAWPAGPASWPGWPQPAGWWRSPGGRLLLLGAVAFCAFLLDGAASNWSAAHLHGDRGASPALAAAGFSAFTAALALGRLAGDRLVARFGRLRVVQASGLVAVAPAILGAVPAVATGPLPLAIAAVTTLGYLGSFTGPPLVGALAQVTGLSAALWLLVAAALVPVALARRALGHRAGDSRQPSLR
jgi:MFS family permease